MMLCTFGLHLLGAWEVCFGVHRRRKTWDENLACSFTFALSGAQDEH